MGAAIEELLEEGGGRFLETILCIFHMLAERSQTRRPHVA